MNIHIKDVTILQPFYHYLKIFIHLKAFQQKQITKCVIHLRNVTTNNPLWFLGYGQKLGTLNIEA